MNKSISWFEIPATDMDRAQKFYEAAFGIQMKRAMFGDEELTLFPYDREGGATGGGLIHAGSAKPSNDGVVIYLYSSDPAETVLSRVDAAGGKVVKQPLVLPNGIGVIGHFTDTEGNRVGVHAMK